ADRGLLCIPRKGKSRELERDSAIGLGRSVALFTTFAKRSSSEFAFDHGVRLTALHAAGSAACIFPGRGRRAGTWDSVFPGAALSELKWLRQRCRSPYPGAA